MCVLQTNTMLLLDALSAGTTTNFSWISANSAATYGSSNIDSCLRDMVLLSTETRLFIKDFTDLTYSDRVSTSTPSSLAQRCAYSSTESKINLESCFPVFRAFGKNVPEFANPDYIEVSCYDVTGWIIAELRCFTGTR